LNEYNKLLENYTRVVNFLIELTTMDVLNISYTITWNEDKFTITWSDVLAPVTFSSKDYLVTPSETYPKLFSIGVADGMTTLDYSKCIAPTAVTRLGLIDAIHNLIIPPVVIPDPLEVDTITNKTEGANLTLKTKDEVGTVVVRDTLIVEGDNFVESDVFVQGSVNTSIIKGVNENDVFIENTLHVTEDVHVQGSINTNIMKGVDGNNVYQMIIEPGINQNLNIKGNGVSIQGSVTAGSWVEVMNGGIRINATGNTEDYVNNRGSFSTKGGATIDKDIRVKGKVFVGESIALEAPEGDDLVTYKLPTNPQENHILTTDSSGNLSWSPFINSSVLNTAWNFMGQSTNVQCIGYSIGSTVYVIYVPAKTITNMAPFEISMQPSAEIFTNDVFSSDFKPTQTITLNVPQVKVANEFKNLTCTYTTEGRIEFREPVNGFSLKGSGDTEVEEERQVMFPTVIFTFIKS
jgi:hypothetical protein